MIKQKDNITIVVSKNNCMKCMLTKQAFITNNIPYEELNIEQTDNFDGYIDFLKENYDVSSMPVIFPAKETGMRPWSDMRPDNIDALVYYYDHS